MNSPLIKPFSAKTRQSITSPNNLQRKSSIISGIIAKAEKKPKLKKRINLGKEEDANGHTALTAGLRSTEPIIPSNFRKNSLVFINSSGLNKKPKEETKSNFHKASEKENKVFIDDPNQSLMDVSRLMKKVDISFFFISLTSNENFVFFSISGIFLFFVIFSLSNFLFNRNSSRRPFT